VRPRFVGKIIFALSIKDIRETADQALTGGFPLMGSDEHTPKKQELMSPCSFFSFSLFCLFCLKSQLKMDAPSQMGRWGVCKNFGSLPVPGWYRFFSFSWYNLCDLAI